MQNSSGRSPSGSGAFGSIDPELIGRCAVIAYFGVAVFGQLKRISAQIDIFLENQETLDALHVLSSLAILVFLGFVVGLTVIRLKPIAAAEGWEPRVSALAGTFTGAFVSFFPPQYEPQLAQAVSGLVATGVGAVLSAYVISFLGRSFSIMAEARELVTHGPYALVRHPLYLAEFVMQIGIVILLFSSPVVVIMTLSWAFQLRRMTNEEKVLQQAFPEYAAYRQGVPRAIPTIRSLNSFFGRTVA